MHKRLAYAAAAALTLVAAPALAQLPGASVVGSAAGAVGATGSAAAQLPSTALPKATPAIPATPGVSPAIPATPATPAGPPPTADQETSASTTASASTSGTNASVTTGMDVKDSTGATIGKITEVKAGAGGKQTATIKMGADTFAVDTSSLAIASGAATVNASQDEIKKMLKKR